MKPLLRSRDSEWRPTAHREHDERELAGEVAPLPALQSHNSAERDDLSRLRSQPEVRFTPDAESATELLSAPCGGHDQASGRGGAVGVLDSAVDLRRGGRRSVASGRERRRSEPASAADVQAGGRSIHAAGRDVTEGALAGELPDLHQVPIDKGDRYPIALRIDGDVGRRAAGFDYRRPRQARENVQTRIALT